MHWSLQSEENKTWIRIVGIVRRNIETNRNFGTILSPGIQLGHFPTHKSIENVHRFGTRCSNSLTNSHLLMVKFTVKIWQMTKNTWVGEHIGSCKLWNAIFSNRVWDFEIFDSSIPASLLNFCRDCNKLTLYCT